MEGQQNKRYIVISAPSPSGPEYRIYDRMNECSIEGGFDTQKWAEAVAEMMEEKYEQDKIRFGNGEVDSRQGTE